MGAVGGWRCWVTMREAAADATRRAVARARCYRPHKQMPLPRHRCPENASRRPRRRRGGRRGPRRRTARWMWNGWLRVAQRLSCGVRAFPYPEPGSRQASQCCRLSSSRRCPGAERHSPVGAATGSRLESDACSRVNISEQCRRPTRCLAQQSGWPGGLQCTAPGRQWD
jgi:hypothetical protein